MASITDKFANASDQDDLDMDSDDDMISTDMSLAGVKSRALEARRRIECYLEEKRLKSELEDIFTLEGDFPGNSPFA